jgi:hypothetical protein
MFVPLFNVNFSLGALETTRGGEEQGPPLLLFQYSLGENAEEILGYRREREHLCSNRAPQSMIIQTDYTL